MVGGGVGLGVREVCVRREFFGKGLGAFVVEVSRSFGIAEGYLPGARVVFLPLRVFLAQVIIPILLTARFLS